MKELSKCDSFGEAITIVNSTNTAMAAKSGSLPVFGTPFMLALMEEATCEAASVLLDEGETTVGIKMNINHTKASGIGEIITANAKIKNIDGKKITFTVTATDSKKDEVGSGEIDRFVVSEERFLKKVETK